jgi:hypothetical protein
MGKKRSTSAFLIYSTEQRPKLKAEEPGLTFGQIAGKLGEAWKALGPAERAPYEEKARAKKQFGRKGT